MLAIGEKGKEMGVMERGERRKRGKESWNKVTCEFM